MPFLVVLVLVGDKHDTFLVADAHNFPELIRTILERRPIDCRCIDDMLWQVVPVVDNSAGEECSSHCSSWVLLILASTVSDCDHVHVVCDYWEQAWRTWLYQFFLYHSVFCRLQSLFLLSVHQEVRLQMLDVYHPVTSLFTWPCWQVTTRTVCICLLMDLNMSALQKTPAISQLITLPFYWWRRRLVLQIMSK